MKELIKFKDLKVENGADALNVSSEKSRGRGRRSMSKG
ncbi:hypothetical protein A2U01_0115664, partial [Trifolium medium]|nr:hypothetical protein [Trifolium medium]